MNPSIPGGPGPEGAGPDRVVYLADCPGLAPIPAREGGPEFLGRVDARGGYAVVETEDPTLIAKDRAVFSAFFDMSVQPVLDIADIAMIGAEAVEFRGSIS